MANAAAVLLAALVQGTSASPATPPPPSATRVAAVRAAEPPVIDGRDDDPIWQATPAITAFREVRPVEGADPKFRTAAKVAYDARNLYVFVRAYDPHPDSIIRLLARRDVSTPSDLISVFIDSFHDRRTGYEFHVTPAGVKLDYAIYADGNEDIAWDGVWDVATQVDSLGWTAEFRIPLSQLRYPPAASDTFGFAIWRTVERTTEQVSWPLHRVSHAGFASQFGELTGLEGLAPPRRTELVPYVVTKNVSVPTATGFDRAQRLTAGGDLKVAVASNLTLNATVNPDFGQVEGDPAVLNLTAFEPFFLEQRPFFVAGNGLFQFSVNCSQVNCASEELFYSRRIGRAPGLLGQYGDANSPLATPILGAAKLTGRLPQGLSLGLLDAVTEHEAGVAGATIEPATNYAVVRATQDLRGGESGLGVMVTGVERNRDPWTAPYLRHSAYVGALDFRHRFLGTRYQLSGSVDLSRVSGSAPAIAATQRDAVHLYQRPDGPLVFDSTRTSLSGDAEELKVGKVGGEHTLFETSYLRRSPGFEINDLGFLLQADQQSWNNWFGLFFNHPNGVFQRLQWNFNWWQYWSAAGLATERAANTNFHTQLNSRWWLHAGGTLGQLGATYCDRCARGGPAVRQDPYVAPWAGIQGDDRHRIIPSVFLNDWAGDAGHSSSLNVNPQVTLNASTRFSTTLGLNATTNHYDIQWFNNYRDSRGTWHYTFAHLEQQTLSLTARAGYTVTPNLSVQWYAQPFVSRGTYSNVRELATPHAAAYGDRYRPYSDTSVTEHPGGVDSRQFNSNLVLRWEYRPGSALFVVWTQGRAAFAPVAGPGGVGGDLRGLFDLHPNNILLVKLSYWLNW